jgi:hypothetical protein
MTSSATPEPAEAPAAAPQPIATVRSYDDLRRAVADWCRQIGMTREELDDEAGLTSGHASKLLSERKIKRLGIVTLGRVMAATGLVLIVATDPEAPPRTAPVHAPNEGRGRSFGAKNGSNTKHWRKTRGAAWGRRMAALRTLKMTPRQRTTSARKAAQARWQRRGTAPTTP